MEKKLLGRFNDLMLKRVKVLKAIEEHYRNNPNKDDYVLNLIKKWYDQTLEISNLQDKLYRQR